MFDTVADRIKTMMYSLQGDQWFAENVAGCIKMADDIQNAIEALIDAKLAAHAAAKAATPKAKPDEGPFVWLTREARPMTLNNGLRYEMWINPPKSDGQGWKAKCETDFYSEIPPPGFPPLAPGECRAYRLVPVEEGE